MKRSLYSYFFDIDSEYVGYSYLADSFITFPIEQKEEVSRIIEYPDDILTNADVTIYKKLSDSKCLISNGFEEYDYLLQLNRKLIYNKDLLALTIVPTMGCNCRCPYCYELHPSLKTSKMSEEVISNIKKYISDNIKSIQNLHISWFGGEPLMCMDTVQDISEFCIKICESENVEFTNIMTTNGVLLNKKNAQILTDCRINALQITLDGPRENHDKTRVLIGGQPTFEIIRKNIGNYLNTDEMNHINLRIHLESNAKKHEIEEIFKTLKLFDDNHRKRITPYTHIIFPACSETWANDSISSSCELSNLQEKTKSENTIEIINEISAGIVDLGYNAVRSSTRINPVACPLELLNSWVVRYDGYLTKCTVGIEKERALAKLTKNGIKLFPERYFKNISREFSSKLYEYCKNCELLPFCWQRCTYQHYLNPNFDDFIAKECPKDRNNWMIKRQINEIKARYKKEKAKNEN